MDWKDWKRRLKALKNEHDCFDQLDRHCHCQICGAICHRHIEESDSKWNGTGMVKVKCTRCNSYERYYDDTGTTIESYFEMPDLRIQQAAVSWANLLAETAQILVKEAEAAAEEARARADLVEGECKSLAAYCQSQWVFMAEAKAFKKMERAAELWRKRDELARVLNCEIYRVEFCSAKEK
ncbi:MAG: hypothetical protein LBK67_00200 [Coriobacteriales bacterium]|jgi:hypothetical protein|nr:hypothetical protein [Coriobacteriales bacterium]